MKFSNFSKKFNADSGILELMNDLGQAVNQHTDISMLGGGNPAHIPQMATMFKEAMMQIMDTPQAFEKMVGNYDAPQGNQAFLEWLADYLSQKYGWSLTYENIAITNGSQSSFATLFNLLAGYDEQKVKQILLPITPEYIGYSDVGLIDKPIFLAQKPIITEDSDDDFLFKYKVDFDNLEISNHVGAMCISRPTNPTGNLISDNELSRLDILAKQHDIPLIIDGAYGLPFPNIVFKSAKPLWNDNIILCLSLSKLGLPGVRTGIVIANLELIKLISSANAIFNLAPGRFGPTLLSQFSKSRCIIETCKQYVTPFYHNRSQYAVEVLRNKLAHLPVKLHRPEGAIFLWAWFKDLPITTSKLYQKLKARGVFIVSGHHFFPGLEEEVNNNVDNFKHPHECIRISYGTSQAHLERGLSILCEEVIKAYRDN